MSVLYLIKDVKLLNYYSKVLPQCNRPKRFASSSHSPDTTNLGNKKVLQTVPTFFRVIIPYFLGIINAYFLISYNCESY